MMIWLLSIGCFDYKILLPLPLHMIMYEWLWHGKLVVIIWKTTIRITLWLRCAKFIHKFIQWLEGHYHIMNQWSIMMICCWMTNAFFDEHELRQSLNGLLREIMLSSELIWMLGRFRHNISWDPYMVYHEIEDPIIAFRVSGSNLNIPLLCSHIVTYLVDPPKSKKW